MEVVTALRCVDGLVRFTQTSLTRWTIYDSDMMDDREVKCTAIITLSSFHTHTSAVQTTMQCTGTPVKWVPTRSHSSPRLVVLNVLLLLSVHYLKFVENDHPLIHCLFHPLNCISRLPQRTNASATILCLLMVSLHISPHHPKWIRISFKLPSQSMSKHSTSYDRRRTRVNFNFSACGPSGSPLSMPIPQCTSRVKTCIIDHKNNRVSVEC